MASNGCLYPEIEDSLGPRPPLIDPGNSEKVAGDKMDIQSLATFFMWCSVINGGILILWTLFYMFPPARVYRVQNRWFPIHRETYNAVMYAFPGLFKMLFLVFIFDLVLYLDLLFIQ